MAQSCLPLCDPMDSIVHQAPLSMGFSRQEYWSGEPFPAGDLPTPGIKPASLHCRWILYHVSHYIDSLKKKFKKNKYVEIETYI